MRSETYISIGIPFYNCEKFLESSILSVLAQTYPYWELILLDDGSTDNSLSIAKKYESKDSRIRVISDGLNKKLPYRLNQIISESKYEYIARMDADDIMHPTRLEVQLNFLSSNPSFDLVSSGIVSINQYNKAYSYRNVNSIFTKFTDPFKSYPIVHPSIFARKEWFLRNRYNTSYPRCEDYELWCRSIIKGDFRLAILPDLLLYYREDGNINAKKMINSYNDMFRAYTYHYGRFHFRYYSKLIIKKNIVKVLDKTGQLQYLAHLRNKKNIDSDIIRLHQSTIDKILKI